MVVSNCYIKFIYLWLLLFFFYSFPKTTSNGTPNKFEFIEIMINYSLNLSVNFSSPVLQLLTFCSVPNSTISATCYSVDHRKTDMSHYTLPGLNSVDRLLRILPLWVRFYFSCLLLCFFLSPFLLSFGFPFLFVIPYFLFLFALFLFLSPSISPSLHAVSFRALSCLLYLLFLFFLIF